LLVVAAPTGDFEFGNLLKGQTSEHVLLAYTLGVQQLIVAVNKMDERTVNWSQARFDELVQGMSSFVKKIGYSPEKVTFLPISGFEGANMLDRSPNLPWYKGPTLIEALDAIVEPTRPVDKPLRIPVCYFLSF
jgi:elongation factor 1-alpha